jgi:LytS/YehU family sensor histidine kinase
VLGGGIFVVIIPALRCIFLPPWDAYDQQFLPRSLETFYGLLSSRFADYTLGYVLIIAAAHAFEFHDRTRRQEIEQSELRRTLAESELQMLKTQLHPHFLFNTLQGISSLTQENPGLAKQMTIALGDLLRAALQHSSTDLIPLDREIAFVNAYLDLEKMRLGERLQVRMNVSQTALQCLVPQLLLQPLVENSIVHGIANTREGGWLEISSELNEEHLRLRVENSVAASATRGTGLGLRNTRSRLRNLYADDASLTFRITPRGTAEALIIIPALRGSAAKCTAS